VASVRVLVADDNADIRLLTKALFNVDGRAEVVSEAEDGLEAVTVFHESLPDVCVLDHQMPGQSGLDAARDILEAQPGARVVLFTSFLTPELVEAAGALGVPCVRKDQYEDLVDVVIDLTA